MKNKLSNYNSSELISFNKKQDEKLILKGLKDKTQKNIDSKFFYDERGSNLFHEITKLDEYYLTKSELSILNEKKKEINTLLPKYSSIVEFGSGSSVKINNFLNALDQPMEYFPIDISQKYLTDTAKIFAKYNPSIKVTPICADFKNISRIKKILKKKKIIGFFPGSTIGNLVPSETTKLLNNFAAIIGKTNLLIIGVDLKKEKKILEKAYNDSKGITADFNKNLLQRINNEFSGFFNIEKFKHKAFYNSKEKRIEMHLESLSDQNIKILNNNISFIKGETIHTENSYKYSIKGFSSLVEKCGFETLKVWTDKKKYFSIFCLKVK